MRWTVLSIFAFSFVLGGCETGSTSGLGDVLEDVLRTAGEERPQDTQVTSLDIEAALRQALEIGTERVSARIGTLDGYWNDPKIQIPLPGRLGRVQEELSGFGLSAPLDDLQLRMNRAAEQAVPAGKRIVIEAVRSITIEDAIGILNGGESAATDFLEARTSEQLRAAFTPFVEDALQNSGAYRVLDDVTSSQPLLAVVATDYKSDLTTHAVQFGLDGVFTYLAIEEKKIREDPVARTTELLRRVFG